MPDNGPACRHVIHTIIRIKTLDGSEKLYSLGELIGYDGVLSVDQWDVINQRPGNQ